MEELSSKVAVVTGAAGGIGLGIATALGGAGARLVLADIDEARLTAAVAELRAEGVDAVGQVTDVTDPDSVDRLADRAEEAHGGVHVVVNNAGVSNVGRQWELSLDDWKWVIDINLWGVVHGVKTFVPRMLAAGQPAHVVNVASMGGLLTSPFVGPYAATKHAVVGMSKALRVELSDTPVDVTVLCPGNVNTDMVDAIRARQAAVGTSLTEDLAGLVDYLESGLHGSESISPAQVGEAVVQAIRDGQFWLPVNATSLLGFAEADFNEMKASAQ